MGILVVTGISIGGWLVSNWDEATWPLLMGAAVGLFSIAGGCRILHAKIEEKINQLENL